MADDVTLLACRCGAEPILVHMGYYCYRVRCEACGEVSTIHATAAIARKKWNKERMAEVALAERDARIAALEAELARLRPLAAVIEAAQAFAKAQQVIWDTPITERTRALFEAELQARLALLDAALHAAKKENNDAERP